MKYRDTIGSNDRPGERAMQPFRWPQPGELWSLWDMLLIVSLPQWIAVAERMEEFRIFWREIENQRQPAASDEQKEALRRIIGKVQDLADDLKLDYPVRSAFDKARQNLPKTHDELHNLFCLFKDAAKARVSLVISMDQANLYRETAPFGPEVASRFHGYVRDELERAAECLALEQPTASVFHLMRAMESVVGDLCGVLNIQNPDREWGKLLSDMGNAVEKMPKDERRKRWLLTHKHLYDLKEVCRNETMHPRNAYALDEATEIFSAQRIFMRHLVDLI